VRDYVSAAALERLLTPIATGNATRHARQLWQVGIADTWLRSAENANYPRELGEELANRQER
jgi:hypothetical protein